MPFMTPPVQSAAWPVLFKLEIANPFQMRTRPRCLSGITVTVTQKKVLQLLPRRPLRVLRIMSRTNQIAHGFCRLVGDESFNQIAASKKARKNGSVSAVRLHLIARLLGREGRRDHDAMEPVRTELSAKLKSERACFVATPKSVLTSESFEVREENVEIVGYRRYRLRGSSLSLRDGDGYAALVDVQTDEP